MHYDFIENNEWVEKALARIGNNDQSDEFRLCLESAFEHEGVSPHNENTHQALTTLAHLGLVVEMHPTGDLSIAQFIAFTLLNYTVRHKTPCPDEFYLKFGTDPINPEASITIPTKSRLLLYYLAQCLRIDIYLFSSRAKAKAFKVDGAVAWVGFFHNIDSYYQSAEYLVLAPSRQPVVTRSLCTTPSPKYPSDIPAAVFRSEKRLVKRVRAVTSTQKRKQVELDQECERVLKRACHYQLTSRVTMEVNVMAKNNKHKDTIEKAKFKDSLVGAKRLPRNTLETAMDIFRSNPNPDADFPETDIQKQLRARKNNVNVWKDTVVLDFDKIWEGTVDSLDAASKKPNRNESLDGEDEDGEDEDGENEDGEHDDSSSGYKSKNIRVCTATLKQILRPELLGNNNDNSSGELERIISIAESRQKTITTVTEEVSVLARKTVYMIASGDIYDSSHGTIESTTFNIRDALPPNFIFRDQSNESLLRVAALPTNLQEHLATSVDRAGAPTGDLACILSSNHIQYLYSQFLGVRNCGKGSVGMVNEEESQSVNRIWDKVSVLITNQSNTVDLPQSPAGLSFTINEHLAQLSTAITNMWEGAIYNKSMDYLLRILLRLHLAPKREFRYQERIKSMREKKRGEAKESKTMTRALWKSKINRLCDELSEVLQRQDHSWDRSERIDIITQRLFKLAKDEPEKKDFQFPSIEKQLQDLETASSKMLDELAETGLTMEEGAFDDEDSLADEDEFDYLDSDDLVMESEGTSNSGVEEPSRARLKSLQVVLKILLESPHISGKVDTNWVKKTAYSGSNFTIQECQVVANLANLLRPYTPKRRPDPDGSSYLEPIAHVTLRAPLVLIANAILRVTGYHQFARQVSPEISPSSMHGLILNAKGIFETFCSSSKDQYNIVGVDGRPLTNGNNVCKNKQAVFESFFDMDKVKELCRTYGLKFADRMTFVDRYTIRITGEVIGHGPNRRGFPVSSEYESRKRDKRNVKGRQNWQEELGSLGMSKDEIEGRVEAAAAAVKEEESVVKKLRRNLAKLTSHQLQISHSYKLLETKTKEAYEQLRSARKEVREARSVVLPRESTLRDLRQNLYYWNNILRSAKNNKSVKPDSKKVSKSSKVTSVTWSQYTVEDATEFLDVTSILNTRGKRRKVVFSGSDYGICTMSETVAQTFEEIEEHINRYQVLASTVEDDTPVPSEVEASFPLDAKSDGTASSSKVPHVKLPRSHKITAAQVNEASHSRRIGKRRERRLRLDANRDARNSLEALSKNELNLKTPKTIAEIDKAQLLRRDHSEALRAFESSKARLKDLKTQRLRTTRAWKKLTSAERRYAKEHARTNAKTERDTSVSTVDGWCNQCERHHIVRSSGRPFSHQSECPKSRQFILPVMLVGSAGTGVGSRIGGHVRRGGRKLREYHQRYCPIGMTNEYRSSQTCVYCFKQVYPARSLRIVGGKIKTVNVHGAKECLNPQCLSFKCGYTIKPRDAQAAVCIAIAGASKLLDPHRQTLPPFSRASRPNTIHPSQSTDTNHKLLISTRYNESTLTVRRDYDNTI